MKLFVEPSTADAACDAEERTQRDGCNCDRREEVLSAKRDRLDGVDGPAWLPGASAGLPPGAGARTRKGKIIFFHNWAEIHV